MPFLQRADIGDGIGIDMFWIGQKDTKYVVSIYHINGVVVGRGKSYHWGEEHPFDWNKLNEVLNFLDTEFGKRRWFYSQQTKEERQSGSRTLITQIKEKWGGIRIYGYIRRETHNDYLSILSEAINRFPGVQDYFSGMCDGIPSLQVFGGTKDECNTFCAMYENEPDERFITLAKNYEQEED